jgi:sugar lactone lactonase YvrE
VKKALATAVLLLATVLAYLSLWPVPIEPVAWQAPPDRGLVDPYLPNKLLQAANVIDLGEHEGPEDATLGTDNSVYATTLSGAILKIGNSGVEVFANVGGRPLGIEADADGSLVIANAFIGLQRIDPDGSVTTLYGSEDAPVFANNLAIAPDGTIYFTEASRKFSALALGDTMEATLYDVMEHGGHGRVIAFDPATGQSNVLLEGLAYANGIAISEAGDFLVIVEMNEYRVLRYWLEGPRRGTVETLIENLPGFGDNLKTGLNGRFWLGFAAPRKPIVDRLSDKPFLRKAVMRLPKFLRPEPELSSHVIAFGGDGVILMNMQDPDVRHPTLTGVLETRENLYLTTLYGHVLPVIAKKDL